MEVALLLLQLAHLCTEFLHDLHTSSHLLLHATLVCIEFLEAGFRSIEGRCEIVILSGQLRDGLLLVLELYEELQMQIR